MQKGKTSVSIVHAILYPTDKPLYFLTGKEMGGVWAITKNNLLAKEKMPKYMVQRKPCKTNIEMLHNLMLEKISCSKNCPPLPHPVINNTILFIPQGSTSTNNLSSTSVSKH